MKYLAFIFLGLISLVVFLVIGLWVFYSFVEINHTIDSDGGYGFSIGDSKALSYQKANSLIEQGELVGFDYVYPKETYNLTYSPQNIERVKEHFHRWDYWVLTGIETPQSERVDFGFENGVLNKIRDVGNGDYISLDNWPLKIPKSSSKIKIGDTSSIVYEKLLSINETYPQLRIEAANLSTYRLPSGALTEEYYLVKDYINWNFRVSSNFFSNSITLTFNENDELIQIHRNRYAFELP